MKALRWILLWILIGVRMQMVEAAQKEIPTRREMERMLVTAPAGRREKRGKKARERTQRPSKKTAREGTPVPQKEAARVRIQGPLKKTAKVETLAPLKQTARERTRELALTLAVSRPRVLPQGRHSGVCERNGILVPVKPRWWRCWCFQCHCSSSHTRACSHLRCPMS